MPTRHEIEQEIRTKKQTAQDAVRRDYISVLANQTGRDTIVYASAFTTPKGFNIPNIYLSISTDDVQSFMSALNGLKGKELDLIIHSPGGSMEATEQIVSRSKYNHIRAIVPLNAMSAATMLACACDEILMGKHSAIGPIDPQVTFPTRSGTFTAPAQAILDEFKQAKEEVAADPKTAPLWVTKIQEYPHGLLSMCQTTLDLAKEKVGDWLDSYMFKDCDDENKKGKKIAVWLGTASNHKTHGRPINIETARDRGLKVSYIEADQKLQDLILSCFHATMVTFQVSPCVKLVENHLGKGTYMNVEVKQG